MTYLNTDDIWFHEGALHFLLLLEVFFVFPDIAGDIGDPKSYCQGQVGVTGVTEGSSNLPGWLKASDRLRNEREVVCGPESICGAFLDLLRPRHLSCGLILQHRVFSGEPLNCSARLEKNAWI